MAGEWVNLGQQPLALWLFKWQLSWSGRHCGFYSQVCRSFWRQSSICTAMRIFLVFRNRRQNLGIQRHAWEEGAPLICIPMKGAGPCHREAPRSVEVASKAVMILVVIMTRSLSTKVRKPWLLRYLCVFRFPSSGGYSFQPAAGLDCTEWEGFVTTRNANVLMGNVSTWSSASFYHDGW